MHEVTKIITRNIDKIIDINYYPTQEAKLSNLLHRPIGIGVQGLADVFALMDLPFYSEDAALVNKQIFETIYHAAMEQSNELAQEREQDLTTLKQSYEIFWKFADNSLECRLYSFVGPSLHEKKTWELLEKYKPIRAETCNKNYIGAYSSI